MPDPFTTVSPDIMLLDNDLDAYWDLEEQEDEMLLTGYASSPGNETAHTPPLLDSSPPRAQALNPRFEDHDADIASLEILPSVPAISASVLIENALRLSLGGLQRKLPHELQARLGTSAYNMSKICPTLFDPDFGASMAQSEVFASKISTSILRGASDAQGLSLKSKLQLLGNSGSDSRDSLEDVEGAVQQQLWVMMHNFSLDSKRARNLKFLRSKARPSFEHHNADDNHYLPTPDSSQRSQQSSNRNLESGFSNGMSASHEMGNETDDEMIEFEDHEDSRSADDFEDILGVNEDSEFEDLLAADAGLDARWPYNPTFGADEAERHRIEQETDEMLLGGGWDEDTGCDEKFLQPNVLPSLEGHFANNVDSPDLLAACSSPRDNQDDMLSKADDEMVEECGG